MDDLISVIIPIYNRDSYVRQCIESVIYQTYQKIQVILVDDGSFDGSVQICNEYSLKDSRIEVVSKKNGGVSSARNQALKQVRGNYVAFIDSDDLWKSNYLEIMYKIIKITKAQIVQCKLLFVPEDYIENITSDGLLETKYVTMNAKSAISSPEYKVSVCAKLFEKSLFDGIVFPEGLVFEDEATYYKFLWKAENVCLVKNPLYCYRQTNNSIMRNKNASLTWDFIEVFEQRIAFFIKIGDTELVQESFYRFAISLILRHASCIQKGISRIEQRKIYGLFIDNYKKIDTSKQSMMTNIILFSYKLFPNMVAKLVAILHLRKKK